MLNTLVVDVAGIRCWCWMLDVLCIDVGAAAKCLEINFASSLRFENFISGIPDILPNFIIFRLVLIE